MTDHKLCQFIVKKYIKGDINWPREIKIAQKLIKKLKINDLLPAKSIEVACIKENNHKNNYYENVNMKMRFIKYLRVNMCIDYTRNSCPGYFI